MIIEPPFFFRFFSPVSHPPPPFQRQLFSTVKMAATSTTSKLLNLSKNTSLKSLIQLNLLRSTPITQLLSSTPESRVPIPFNREVTNVNTNAETLKKMNPSLGFSFGMMGLPGFDQSGRILNVRGRPVSAVDDDKDFEVEDLDSDDSSDVGESDSDVGSGSDSD